MRTPYSPYYFLALLLVLSVLMALVQVGLVNLSFQKLNLSPQSAFLLLFTSFFGSAINLPLFTIKSEAPPARMVDYRGLLRASPLPFTGKTIVAVNVGGGLIPIGFSLYLFLHNPISLLQALLGTGFVAGVSYALSRPIAGLGIAMPGFAAPIAAALIAIMLGGEQSPALAYICGSLGVLIGADLMRLKDIRTMGAPIASIGGAGTFDGIFLTGLVAVLLS